MRVKQLLSRLLGYLIDWYLLSLILNAIIVTFTFVTQGLIFKNLQLDYFTIKEAIFLMVAILIADGIYNVIIPTYLFKGQTIGKKLTKNKIVKKDRSELKITDLVKRNLIGTIIIEASYSPVSNYFRSLLLIVGSEKIVSLLVTLSIATGIISAVIMFIDKESRMLHDIISGTKVINISEM